MMAENRKNTNEAKSPYARDRMTDAEKAQRRLQRSASAKAAHANRARNEQKKRKRKV
jgi:hypothetical protein